MKVSNNALALFFFISTTSYTTVVNNVVNGFIVRPTASKIHVNTGLGYIKEGYETGIGPDILRRSRSSKSKQPVQEEQEQKKEKESSVPPPHQRRRSRNRTTSSPSVVVPDGIIDAVVIEEDHDNSFDQTTSTFRNDNNNNNNNNNVNANVVFDDTTISERLKREISSKSPSGVFPDLYESEKEQVGVGDTKTGTIWDTTTAKTIQGGSLRTWSMEVPEVDHTQVLMRNSLFGYPIRAQLDVLNGPDNVPMKLAVFSTCGLTHPFSCIIPTPGYTKQSIGIKNTGPIEFPIEAVVIADIESVREKQQQQQQSHHQSHSQSHQQQQGGYGGFYSTVGPTSTSKPETAAASTSTTTSTTGLGSFVQQLRELGDMRKIDGTSAVAYGNNSGGCDGEIYEFESNVDSVQVLIEAVDGRSCQARIELTYGDSDEIVQVIELAIEDGRDRPFFAVIDTPKTAATGYTTGTKIRIVNLDKYSAFPLRACVEPYTISDNDIEYDNHEYNYDNNIDDDDETNASTFNYDDVSSTIPDCTIPVTSNHEEESFAMY